MRKNCPQCNETVYNDLPGGMCPNCLMAHAQQSISDAKATRLMPEQSFPDLDTLTRLFPELEVEEMIGHGGMGAVYRVRQRNLDRVVALKVFLYDTNDAEFAARFQREARALAKLSHPNIVTVHDFGKREHMHYLLMEYIDGLNLRQITESERLNPVEALEMVPQLCDALQYAHDKGVIHRDIKPENLLLDVNGRIKIADFGLAKMTGTAYEGTLTRTRQVMGTLNYMAPEQRERPSEVDHRADIYSLGVVIYEMLTGELPFGRFQPPSSKSDIDISLDEVVMRALEKEPDRRYQQASEFKTGFATATPADVSHVAAAQANVSPALPSGTPLKTPSYDPQVYSNVADVSGAASPAPADTAFYTPAPPVKATSRSFDDDSWRLSVALFSGCDKKGNWRPGSPQVAITMFGATSLDLCHVEAEEVTINLFTLFGGSEIIVPRGAQVDFDGLMVFGGIDNKILTYDGPERSNMRVRIRAYGGFGATQARTPTVHEVPLPVLPTPLPPNKSAVVKKRTSGLKRVMLVGVSFLAMVLLTAAIVFFCSTGSGRLNVFHLHTGNAKMAAWICLFGAVFIWSSMMNFRRILSAGPGSREPDKVASYHEKTFSGAVVHAFALFCMYTGITLFLIRPELGGVIDARTTALLIGLGSIPFFWLAGQLSNDHDGDV